MAEVERVEEDQRDIAARIKGCFSGKYNIVYLAAFALLVVIVLFIYFFMWDDIIILLDLDDNFDDMQLERLKRMNPDYKTNITDVIVYIRLGSYFLPVPLDDLRNEENLVKGMHFNNSYYEKYSIFIPNISNVTRLWQDMV